ncbi:hypothetical protein ACFTXM_42925 [Streptomyces sp. NPDC056930]|uniref:hypothetical protein n=1 Tax=Streptomyces sp. NPDC056930 TaxID=3345967 RepID=UPI0036417399
MKSAFREAVGSLSHVEAYEVLAGEPDLAQLADRLGLTAGSMRSQGQMLRSVHEKKKTLTALSGCLVSAAAAHGPVVSGTSCR